MQYTIDDLKLMLSNPIDSNKWGKDTHTVLDILRVIMTAGCSSCMFKRKVSELDSILNKYGDSIRRSDNYAEITHTPSDGSVKKSSDRSPNTGYAPGRISCPDCVAKHMSEAYVLQCEYYQGYTEYLSLIEAHLNEALAECPRVRTDLINLINSCLRSVIVDKEPNIPIILTEKLLHNTSVSHASDSVQCTEIPTDKIEHALIKMPFRDLSLLVSILDTMPMYTKDSDPHIKLEWGGCMALISDIMSRHSIQISSEVRRRRLKYFNNPDENDRFFMYCEDIADILKKTHNELLNMRQ